MRLPGDSACATARRRPKTTSWLLDAAIVSGLCLGVVFVQVAHYRNFHPLLYADYASHFLTAVALHTDLAHGRSFFDALDRVLNSPTEYPPLSYLWTRCVFLVHGVSFDSAFLSQLLWIACIVTTVYLFVANTSGRVVGAVAALLTGTSTSLSFATLRYSPDLALAATALAALYLLSQDAVFEKPALALLFGVALGASLLAKWTALFFLAAPLTLVILRVLAGASPLGRRRFFLLSICIAAATWLMINRWKVNAIPITFAALAVVCVSGFFVWRWAQDPGSKRASYLLAALLTAYLMAVGFYAHMLTAMLTRLSIEQRLIQEMPIAALGTPVLIATTTLLGLPLLLTAGLVCLRRAERCAPGLQLAALAAFFGVGLTLMSKLDSPRYYAPVVPIVIVLSVYWLRQASVLVRAPILGALIALAAVQATLLTYPLRTFMPDKRPYGFLESEANPLAVTTYLDRFVRCGVTEGPDELEPVLQARMSAALQWLDVRFGPRQRIINLVYDKDIDVIRGNVDHMSTWTYDCWQSVAASLEQPVFFRRSSLEGGVFFPEATDNVRVPVARFPTQPNPAVSERCADTDMFLLFSNPAHLPACLRALNVATGKAWHVVHTMAWLEHTMVFFLAPES